jgi:dephospho-CoA kinase
LSEKTLVLGSTGMPGSGKSLIAQVALERGYDVVVMGDIVREEAEKKGLHPTPENIGKTMIQLRQTEGKAVMARKCIPKIEERKNLRVLVDGVRSLNEVDEFKRHYGRFSLIAVHASPETRFRRLYDRKRSDDATAWKVFHERDMRELSVGLGDAIAMAEEMVVNEDSQSAAEDRIRKVLEKIEQKWMK